MFIFPGMVLLKKYPSKLPQITFICKYYFHKNDSLASVYISTGKNRFLFCEKDVAISNLDGSRPFCVPIGIVTVFCRQHIVDWARVGEKSIM